MKLTAIIQARMGSIQTEVTDQQSIALNVTKALQDRADESAARTAELLALLKGNEIRDIAPANAFRHRHEFVVVDVRSEEEFFSRLGHVDVAHHIPLNDQFSRRMASLSKEAPVLFVCRSGGRSKRAATIAHQKGFKSVFNLSGGMLAWERAKLPTTRE